MKLRNKKTGKVYTACCICFGESLEGLEKTNWKTLKEFCEDWEDYGPAEPLIKDEKIRKAVRAWAEANGIVYARKCGSLNAYTRRLVGFDALATSYTIEFEKHLKLYGDSDKIEKDSYTIAELCGEDE